MLCRGTVVPLRVRYLLDIHHGGRKGLRDYEVVNGVVIAGGTVRGHSNPSGETEKAALFKGFWGSLPVAGEYPLHPQ